MAKNNSFLPDDYLAKRIERRTNVICLVLFVLVVAGIGSVWYLTYQRQLDLRAAQAQVKARSQKAQQLQKQHERLQKKKRQMIHKARVTSALVERVPRNRLLAELINHMPAELSLLDLEVTSKVIKRGSQPRTAVERAQMKQSSKEGFKVDVKPRSLTVDLVGVAPTDVQVSEYMGALGRYPLFSDVNLLYSEQTTLNDNELRKFRVRIDVANGVDVREIEPTKVARELKQDPMSDKVRINASGQIMPARHEASDESGAGGSP